MWRFPGKVAHSPTGPLLFYWGEKKFPDLRFSSIFLSASGKMWVNKVSGDLKCPFVFKKIQLLELPEYYSEVEL